MFRHVAICLFFSCFVFACGTPTPTNNNNNNNNNNNTTNTGKKRDANSSFSEPSTDVKFKGLLDVKEGKEPFFLMGMGVRTKTIFAVKVYAIGYYVEPTPAKELLKDWKGKKKEDIAKDDKFFDILLNGKFGKSIRLVMVRDVDAETMSSAFTDSLEPRIGSLLQGADQDKAKKSLETFKTYFDAEMKDNQEILFTWRADGKLDTTIDGKFKGTLDDKGLALCLFDVYVGKDPISADAKTDTASGINDLFAE